VSGYTLLQKAKGYIALIRPITALLAILGVFVGGILGGLQFFSIYLILAMIVVFFMVAGSMAINDYLDWKIDQLAHPTRPIPSGTILPKEALYFSCASFSIAVLLSMAINFLSFGIVVAGLGLLILYEKYYKNIGFFGNILAAFISGMALIFGGAAVGNVHYTFLLAAMTFFIMLGREILKDVQDVKGDALHRVTLPMTIGRKNALYVGCMFIAATVALVPFPYWWNILSFWYIVIIIPAALLFMYSILISLKDIKNIGISIEILRSGSAFALIGFILGIVA
jgi:4-hydroxybenzoate polyprenyltransferase